MMYLPDKFQAGRMQECLWELGKGKRVSFCPFCASKSLDILILPNFIKEGKNPLTNTTIKTQKTTTKPQHQQ